MIFSSKTRPCIQPKTLKVLLMLIWISPAHAIFEFAQCVEGFLGLSLVLNDFTNFDTYFHQDARSKLIFAEAGNYYGSDGIEEYLRIVDHKSNPFFDLMKEVATEISPEGFDREAGTCTANANFVVDHIFNPAFSKGGAFSGGVSMSLTFDMNANKITDIYAYVPKGVIHTWFDQTFTDSGVERLCTITSDSCADVFEQNGITSVEECKERMQSLDMVTGDNYFDGESFACRLAHGIMAEHNPDHCPHISFLPMEDKDGTIKCQESAGNLPTDVLSASKIANFETFMVRHGIDPTVGIKTRCTDTEDWHQRYFPWRGCEWVSQNPSRRCEVDGAKIACRATCEPDCN